MTLKTALSWPASFTKRDIRKWLVYFAYRILILVSVVYSVQQVDHDGLRRFQYPSGEVISDQLCAAG